MYVELPNNNEKALHYFRSAMDREEYGTERYEKIRKVFAWLCEQARIKDKTEQMGIVR